MQSVSKKSIPDDSKLEILQLFPFFKKLSDSYQSKLIENGEFVSLPAGAHYFEEGNSCNGIALVGSGDIRVFKRGETGREITLYHVERGETCILTASCILAQSAYPAAAIVDRHTTAVLFPGDLFRDWVARNEVIRQFVFFTLASRMGAVMTLIEELTFRKLDERLIDFLKGKLNSKQTLIEIRMTHEEIAIELGSAREVISRLLKDFERRGLLKQSRGVILPQEALLRYECRLTT